MMNDSGPRKASHGGIENGGSVDLFRAPQHLTSSPSDGPLRSPTFNHTKATLTAEIQRTGQPRLELDGDLGASSERCPECGSAYIREEDDELAERSAQGERKKLVKYPCPSGRCSSSPRLSKTRRTNDLLSDVRCPQLDFDLAGSHRDLVRRSSALANGRAPDPSQRARSPSGVDQASFKHAFHDTKHTFHNTKNPFHNTKNTFQNTVQTKLIGCPRISVEKSLGSMSPAGVALTHQQASDKPVAATVDDLKLATKTKIAGARHRKLSIPLLKPPSSSLDPLFARGRSVSPARRKFSNVSDAVSRKISTTIGWRTRGTEEVVPQAKYLCSQYIRCRLRRAGLLHKKIGLQRIRSVVNLQWGVEACEVFPRLLCLGQELERSHPQLYSSVVRQLSVSLKSDKVVRHVVLAVSSHLLRSDITWAKIISLYAISAALAADCVKQGHPEFVTSVVEGVGMAIEQHSGQWIVSQGGWSGVLLWSQPPAFELTPLQMLMMIGAAGVSIAALIGGVISLLDHLMS